MTKVLVTGASGFIGGHLTHALVQKGMDVRVLVRSSSNVAHLEGLPIERIEGSLTDRERIQIAVKDVQIIYHCAALSSDWGPYQAFHAANVEGVQNVVDAALRNDQLERMVHISTTDVYGYPKQACDETYPITNIGLSYNITKGSGERIVWDAIEKHNLPATIIRPVSVYGPRGTEFVETIADFINSGLMAVFNGGHTHAGLLHVANGVACIIDASLNPIANGQAYNLRDDFDVSWRQYLDAFAAKLGTRRPWLNLPVPLALGVAGTVETVHRTLRLKSTPFITRHAVLLMCRDQGYSIEKAKRELGFRTTVGLDQGLDESITWLKSVLNH